MDLKRIIAAVAVAAAFGLAFVVAWRMPLRALIIHDTFTVWYWHF